MVTNPQGLKKIWVSKSTWVLCCRVQRRISGSWVEDAQDTWPEMNPSLLSLQTKKRRICYIWRQWKGRIIGQGNIGNDTSSLIESVLLVDGLKHNLLSVNQLCDKGFKVIFKASHCIIKDIQNDKTIFMGHRCDNVYTINISKYDDHDRCFFKHAWSKLVVA